MIDLYCLITGRLAFAGSLGFGPAVAEIAPFTSAPAFAASCMKSVEAETAFTIVAAGCQPIVVGVTSALIDGLGVAMSKKRFAPDAFSFSICWTTSGAVTSNGSASTIFDAPEPRYFFSEAR